MNQGGLNLGSCIRAASKFFGEVTLAVLPAITWVTAHLGASGDAMPQPRREGPRIDFITVAALVLILVLAAWACVEMANHGHTDGLAPPRLSAARYGWLGVASPP